MTSDLSEYQTIIEQQEKSETQKQNWITYEETTKTLQDLEADAKLLYKKKALTMTDMQHIQNYVILCLLSGAYIAPRRSLDYVCMKVRNIKKSEDNWFDKTKLYFNRYKTAKYYKEQVVDLPPALKKILDKWSSVNKHTDWLFFDVNSAPLTSVKLNQRLARILGSGRSVNALRHSYLQHLYGDTIKLNEKINKTMTDMGSSKSQLQVYIKKDD
jgi:integrase